MVKGNPFTRLKHKQARICFCANQFQQANRLYKQICEKDKLDHVAWTLLGITHGHLNEHEEAIGCLEKSVALNPDSFEANYNLGRALFGKGLFERAIVSYGKALRLKQEHVDTLLGLGVSYAQLDLWTKAQSCYEQALRQSPRNAATLGNLGNVMRSQGEAKLATQYYRRAVSINPQNCRAYSNLLLSLHYSAPQDPVAIFQEHLAWGALQAEGTILPTFQSINRERHRQLRIGYVTPDLRNHSVAYFIEPLLAHHDRSQFEIICYLELGVADHMTERLERLAGSVRKTNGLSDGQMMTMIRNDQVDILVDLAGHTSNNRLSVFARKPAPVQITYLGYPNTTGLPTIDYRLTDEWTDPTGMTEHLHTEKLVRIENGFLCFMPPEESPDITPLPSVEQGYITFGSFNALPKITADMLRVWAKIILRVPNSRLLIKNAQLTDPVLQESLRARLVQHGVDDHRVEIQGRTSKDAHMASLGKVDIALDTFPYHGTTTTCDTLWMGIPVVTLAGISHVSRVGVSLLTRVGLSELIAQTEDGYVESSVYLASNPERLKYLRANLRKMFVDSGLTNGHEFTCALELVYRQLWQSWCDEN